jgi:uncharacterized membrane protein
MALLSTIHLRLAVLGAAMPPSSFWLILSNIRRARAARSLIHRRDAECNHAAVDGRRRAIGATSENDQSASSHWPADRIRRGSADLRAAAIGRFCLRRSRREPGRSRCYGISYVYIDRFLVRRGIGSVTLSACQLLAAAVLLAIALGVAGAPSPRWSVTTAASILVLGLIGAGAAYVLNYQIISSEGATIASTVTYLLPVVAIILGVIALNESVTLLIVAGIILVLIGVALTRNREPTSATDRAR